MENISCDELITSLTSFLRLYSRHGARIQSTSESFALTATQLVDAYKSVADRAVFTVIRGGLGAASGGLSGGVCGALGTIAAVTWCRFCDDDINAVGATLSFFGGILGGVAGGVCGGAVGSVVGVAGAGSSLWGLLSDLSSLTIGYATGAAVGGIFGETAGAAGGAIGGVFGALSGVNVAVKFVEPNTNLMEKAGDFGEAIEPLVEELKTIKAISDKMTSNVFMHGAAGQTAKTLASVSAMEKMMGAYRTTGQLRFVQDAVKQCKKITEELETTRAEAEKCLTSVKTQKLDK
ncbi:uncharacterized protein LOC109142848 [Larimichthys crocea]|uniref:uncharacterized protein LOC109142848 n=1 Tax=Larimichthys crocea TaxID=215358 RepID=UPI0009019539|nr:uncharacterized protein LOC109142848 [Larimichthys crocea]